MALRRGSSVERALAARREAERKKDVTVESGSEAACPFETLTRDLDTRFREMDPEGRALLVRHEDRERRRDPKRPPTRWLPTAYGAPVRFTIGPKKLRGHFYDDGIPQLTIECSRPSGYGHDFTREVSVRYLAGKRGVNIDQAIKFAVDVARRYKLADEKATAMNREQEERRDQERKMSEKLGAYDAGISLGVCVYGYWTASPSMSSRAFEFTAEGLRAFVKLAKAERAKCAKLRAAYERERGESA